jgi:hypothetical protein
VDEVSRRGSSIGSQRTSNVAPTVTPRRRPRSSIPVCGSKVISSQLSQLPRRLTPPAQFCKVPESTARKPLAAPLSPSKSNATQPPLAGASYCSDASPKLPTEVMTSWLRISVQRAPAAETTPMPSCAVGIMPPCIASPAQPKLR